MGQDETVEPEDVEVDRRADVPRSASGAQASRLPVERALDSIHRSMGRPTSGSRYPRVDALFGGGMPPRKETGSAPRPDSPAAPPAPASPVPTPAADRVRVAIHDLVVRREPHTAEVVATLRLGDRRSRGAARAVPTRCGSWRAIGEATLAALSELVGPALRASVQQVSVTQDPPIASVVLTVQTGRGDEVLLGVALQHGDPEGAVMRATLDALNRRVDPMLSHGAVDPTA